MMCSIFCLQMRLPKRAGSFLYLACAAMSDPRRRVEINACTWRFCCGQACLVMPRLMSKRIHGHGHAHTWSRSCSYTSTAMPTAPRTQCAPWEGSESVARSARATAAEIRSSTRLEGVGGL
jgi:hypothetical protein